MAGYAGFQARKPLTGNQRLLLAVFSFVLPLGIWSAVSYLPFIWHPFMKITDAGASEAFRVGDLVEKDSFKQENLSLSQKNLTLARGEPANPVFLPAPDVVAQAFVKAFVTPPRRDGDPWLHESLLRSIGLILWAFFLSSLVGVPLGVLCGTYGFFRGLFEPFIEFFRYLPAPAFGALAVAIWGIEDGPKAAIIVIGTFFQQVLIVSNTTSRIDPTLLESAQTMGGGGMKLLTRVVVPGILPELYKDQRILLGWAWTYLIVSEVVGTSSGITFFINQQAKYRVYENVFAAIIMIGLIGIASDRILAALGRVFFPWHRLQTKE